MRSCRHQYIGAAIAGTQLLIVQIVIDAGEELIQRLVVSADRHGNTCGGEEVWAQFQPSPSDRLTNTRGDQIGVARVGDCADCCELVSSAPRDEFFGPQAFSYRFDGRTQDAVAERVAVDIVDGFEVVDVYAQNRDAPTRELRALDLVGDSLTQSAQVGCACERVND